MEVIAPEAACPPQLAGLFASLTGMIVGSLLPMGRHRALEQHATAHKAAAHHAGHPPH